MMTYLLKNGEILIYVKGPEPTRLGQQAREHLDWTIPQ